MARILVIEDNAASLNLFTYILRRAGHVALEAPDGASALRLAAEMAPDLVLCDIGLPDMDGFEVLRRLRCLPGIETVPVMAVTAFAMLGDRERILAQGFNGYLAKPVEPRRFLEEVGHWLGEKGEEWLRF